MLTYSFLDYNGPIQCPPRQVNGGLYTGEGAKGDWGNVPITPEPDTLANNLLSAKPPPGAEKIPMSYERPGNNHVLHPHHKRAANNLNINCITQQ